MTTKPKLEQIRACLRRVSNPFRTKMKKERKKEKKINIEYFTTIAL